jgi:hypothetical protein
MKLFRIGFDESGGPGAHRHPASALCELASSSDRAKDLLADAKAVAAGAHKIESKLALAAPHDRAVQLKFIRGENLNALSAP